MSTIRDTKSYMANNIKEKLKNDNNKNFMASKIKDKINKEEETNSTVYIGSYKINSEEIAENCRKNLADKELESFAVEERFPKLEEDPDFYIPLYNYPNEEANLDYDKEEWSNRLAHFNFHKEWKYDDVKIEPIKNYIWEKWGFMNMTDENIRYRIDEAFAQNWQKHSEEQKDPNTLSNYKYHFLVDLELEYENAHYKWNEEMDEIYDKDPVEYIEKSATLKKTIWRQECPYNDYFVEKMIVDHPKRFELFKNSYTWSQVKEEWTKVGDDNFDYNKYGMDKDDFKRLRDRDDKMEEEQDKRDKELMAKGPYAKAKETVKEETIKEGTIVKETVVNGTNKPDDMGWKVFNYILKDYNDYLKKEVFNESNVKFNGYERYESNEEVYFYLYTAYEDENNNIKVKEINSDKYEIVDFDANVKESPEDIDNKNNGPRDSVHLGYYKKEISSKVNDLNKEPDTIVESNEETYEEGGYKYTKTESHTETTNYKKTVEELNVEETKITKSESKLVIEEDEEEI